MRPAWPAVVTRVSAGCGPSVFRRLAALFTAGWLCVVGSFTLNKLECFKQASRHEYISME